MTSRVKKVVCVLTLVMCIGCAEQKIIDRLGVVNLIGYDRIEQSDATIRTTIVAYQESQESKETTTITEATNNTSKGARNKINLKTATKNVIGQLRVVLYGEPLAKEGIITLTDTLQRDSEIGTDVFLAVAKGSAKQLLSENNKPKMNIGEFLFHMITKNERRGLVPSPTLNRFLNAYYRKGRDPVLPYLEHVKGEIMITKLALMKDDRLVGTLGHEQGFFLKTLMDNHKFDSFEVKLEGNHLKPFYTSKSPNLFITLSNISSDVKLKLVDAKTPLFHIRVKIMGQMEEISQQMDLQEKEAIHALEREASRSLKKQYEQLIKRLQELQVDPVGFGSEYRSSVRVKDFSSEKWRGMYEHAQFEFDVNVRFTNVGITS
ncbi:Ger(x)C family spore germination protein [Paenibacillus sp. 481]|uniref:Ger(x)C family spore germination protein n=1 Tax=Paenibacillus sp. 481 TaxID=2835869 RepID=UPI001E618A16|nr:Ger(x)C family spore germination protein [Paenibacillus sp. 481]UHA73814.1 Ger(x)C family spore germination protein [Paenibacillus sp. 481]